MDAKPVKPVLGNARLKTADRYQWRNIMQVQCIMITFLMIERIYIRDMGITSKGKRKDMHYFVMINICPCIKD